MLFVCEKQLSAGNVVDTNSKLINLFAGRLVMKSGIMHERVYICHKPAQNKKFKLKMTFQIFQNMHTTQLGIKIMNTSAHSTKETYPQKSMPSKLLTQVHYKPFKVIFVCK